MPFIDNVYLSDDEIKQISETNYQKETGRLYLKGLNILRCEQRYKFTNNIKRITQHLTGSKNSKELTLPILIGLLKERTLYAKLDKFYTEELRKYVFYDDIEQEKDINLNKDESIIKDLLDEYDININDFQQLFSEIGYEEHFKRSMKKVQYRTQGKYYKELFKKFKI